MNKIRLRPLPDKTKLYKAVEKKRSEKMFPPSLFISHTITANERGSIIICDLKLKQRACKIRKISMFWPHFFSLAAQKALRGPIYTIRFCRMRQADDRPTDLRLSRRSS